MSKRFLSVSALTWTAFLALPAYAQQPHGETAVITLASTQGDGVALAENVRQALTALNAKVLTLEETRQRMAGPRGLGQAVSTASAESTLKEAEKLSTDEKYADSIALVEVVIRSLEGDSDQSVEKAELSRAARVKLASIHLQQAGRAETGQGNTDGGKRAQEQLKRIVMADPAFTLDPARYPPRLRNLLDRARADAAKLPRGALEVRSHPAGATVFLDGRALGLAPLRTNTAAAAGTYRIWLEYQGRRSLVRTVTLKPDWSELAVDMPVECSLQPAQASIRMGLVDVEETILREVSALLGVRTLVVIVSRTKDAAVVVYDADRALIIRRGQALHSTPSLATVLARFSVLGLVGDEVKPMTISAPVIPTPTRVAVVGTGAPLWNVQLHGGLRRGLAQYQVTESVTPEAMKALEDRCKGDVACVLNAVKVLNADGLIWLDIEPERPFTRLEAALFDVATGRELRRVIHRVKTPSPAEAMSLMVKLLAPSEFIGALDIRAPREGLHVWLDGAALGTTPVKEGLTGLPVGRHIVRMGGPSLSDAEDEVDVPMGTPVVVTATLSGQKLSLNTGSAPAATTLQKTAPSPATPVAAPSPTEPVAERNHPVWAWGVVGGGAAAALVTSLVAVGGLITAGVFTLLFRSYDRGVDGGVVLRPGETPQQATARAAGTGAGIVVGAGLGVLGALGLLASAALMVTGVVLWFVLA